ncbi:MAG: 5'/3'-nucleotidase SurE [Gammaproteobacteria bacterium]
MPSSRPRILLTNADSHDSPLFHRAIDALRRLGDLAIAVPATEQSWKGKSMTRYGPVFAERIVIHDAPAWSVTGTPADCVNLALYQLLDAPPDIVVSGINIGKNVGLGFVYASGTVGACLEANIAGLPALALSQELSREDFMYWDENRAFQPTIAAALAQSIDALVPRVWEMFVTGHFGEPTTWNVNFPAQLTPAPAIHRTRLGLTTYGNCFQRKGDQFHFGLTNANIDPAPDTDDATLKAGHVSATLLDIRDFGQDLAGG